MRTLIILSLTGILHASLFIASAEPELKGTPAELGQYLNSLPGTITLTATAEVKAEANRAVLHVRIDTKEKLLQQALDKNRKIRDEIVKALTARGLDKDGIHISKFSSASTYGWFSKSKPGAYEINSSVEVNTVNESDERAVAELIDSMPEVTLESLTFEQTDNVNLKKRSVEEALDKINAQKKVYEEKLGVTLRPRSIPGAVQTRQDIGIKAGRAMNASLSTTSFSGLSSSEQIQPVSQFDQLSYQAEVAVIFDILPRETNK